MRSAVRGPQKTRKSSAPRPYIGYVGGKWHTRQPLSPQQLAAISWCRSHHYRTTERAVLGFCGPWTAKPQKTRKSSAPRPYIGYVGGKWHTRQPLSPQQLAAISWCRSHHYRTTERAVLGFCGPWTAKPQKTRKSSAPRPYIGYVSGQWHTRQPLPPQQLAAISWCRSHDYRTTERAVRRHGVLPPVHGR